MTYCVLIRLDRASVLEFILEPTQRFRDSALRRDDGASVVRTLGSITGFEAHRPVRKPSRSSYFGQTPTLWASVFTQKSSNDRGFLTQSRRYASVASISPI